MCNHCAHRKYILHVALYFIVLMLIEQPWATMFPSTPQIWSLFTSTTLNYTLILFYVTSGTVFKVPVHICHTGMYVGVWHVSIPM